MRAKAVIGALGLLVAAGAGHAQIQFFSSDDATYYRGTGFGLDAVFSGADEIRGMSVLENGVSINGASAGDVIAVSSPQGGNDPQTVYRVDNAFSGTPALVQLGQTAEAVSDLAFANGRIFGVDNSGPAGTIVLREFDTSFGLISTFDTGIQIVDTGAGGLAYDPAIDMFYITAPDTDELYRYSLGGSAELIGAAGVNFGNNDLAFWEGRLYSALADTDRNSYLFGEFDVANGSFSTLVNVGDYLGGAIGAVVVPGAPTLGLLGAAGLLAARRRR